LQKPDGLVIITPDNIDEHLAKMKLQDLPGIASANEQRLRKSGINSPLEMRHSSAAVLRKVFGGVVGEYWHRRLNFGEVDMYNRAENRTMSATRTLSRRQSQDRQQLESMLIALCTRLEQRMVKGGLFCKEVTFAIRYRDGTKWETAVKMPDPVQDANELRGYIQERIAHFENGRSPGFLFNPGTTNLTVVVQSFVKDSVMQYSLFDNRLKKDVLRKVVYEIKDMYDQKNIVRRGNELFSPYVMKDAIGFGSVKDMIVKDGQVKNKHLLEEDEAPGEPRKIVIRRKEPPPLPKEVEEVYYEYAGPDYNDVINID
jgi:DNA polymerase-4